MPQSNFLVMRLLLAIVICCVCATPVDATKEDATPSSTTPSSTLQQQQQQPDEIPATAEISPDRNSPASETTNGEMSSEEKKKKEKDQTVTVQQEPEVIQVHIEASNREALADSESSSSSSSSSSYSSAVEDRRIRAPAVEEPTFACQDIRYIPGYVDKPLTASKYGKGKQRKKFTTTRKLQRQQQQQQLQQQQQQQPREHQATGTTGESLLQSLKQAHDEQLALIEEQLRFLHNKREHEVETYKRESEKLKALQAPPDQTPTSDLSGYISSLLLSGAYICLSVQQRQSWQRVTSPHLHKLI